MIRETIVKLAQQAGRAGKSIPPVKLPYKNMLRDPSTKYRTFVPPKLSNRQWPDRTITKAPRWLSTDLRDGNQSLPDPMSVEQKKEYFHKLVEVGFKEIEVSFPSASQTDFDFTRYAVEHAPDDVNIQCLVQSREHLIRRTVEALTGAKRATVHTYLATSDLFRNVVFKMSKEEAIRMAIEATKLVRKLTKDDPAQQATRWSYEFSPETFSDTPGEFAVEICEAVKSVWEPTEDNPIIFNLPATVEVSTPNVYADQIEYFATHISEREKVCISTHCHNDRGCGVAASELGLLAGADRVEGCLFGNGERTGNVDLVTVALNLYTNGVSPNLDLSELASIIEVVERCNKIPISQRAPYGGELVVCAFSGSHQDAIKKGFAQQEIRRTQGDNYWSMPYLPLDPKDIGRDYAAVIRVNSQSGKGGAAWIILRSLGLDLPRKLQIEFSKVVQNTADGLGRELKSSEICDVFRKHYNYNSEHYSKLSLLEYDVLKVGPDRRTLTGKIVADGTVYEIEGSGNGPISSLIDALSNFLNVRLTVDSYAEHSLGSGSSTQAATYVSLAYRRESDNELARQWGVGISEDVGDASFKAIFSSVNSIVNAGEISLTNTRSSGIN
ncbi:ZYBA0S12-01002g1_1 [Zygosaccharomyces bailii CLIB 213]|uniref:2-isopropylmalate synthase n=1 Tax=Zygosaccharomyces bailii (strain CLIB 213 / ATCC 58445 / CBS 680 / BCRC 21525 / NBRC 1098 / NCYC 1416 / NRRL Y-2227) TaxID=1333698 RepID=A0A8J2XAV6_ZYGB2|nr:ZYBA0S12-01002g1_1 [Zygosaccharomyces bailii CLIB 213]